VVSLSFALPSYLQGKTLYAFVMGWPEKQAVIAPLGSASPHTRAQIEQVELLGFPGKLKWACEV
jgi:alpha-L-fucosidase